MSGLLPSKPDVTPDRDPDPRVIGLDSDDASEMLAALSSDTARKVLAALHEEPATPSVVADSVETSLQNAQYHLEKLEAADLIEEVDTVYSSKGREMSVYAPRDGPLVVFPGSPDDAIGLTQMLKQVTGAVLVLGVASLLVESLAGGGVFGFSDLGYTDDDAPADDVDDTAPEIATDDAPDMQDDAVVGVTDPGDPHWAIELITGVPPGALFFAAGCLLLLFVIVLWYRQHYVALARSPQ